MSVRGSVALVVVLATAAGAHAADVPVSTTTELQTAIANAKAGDTISLADGTYDATGFSCSASGSPSAPIVVKAKNRRAAIIRFDALEGWKVGGDHWHFEGLVIRGVCADDNDCEHAFHVGGAQGFVMRDCAVSDFNAQLKVNAVPDGASYRLPHGGLVEDCELFDSRARNTDAPTTKLNIDSGDDWIVRRNFIHDFEKGGGDHVSYGVFLKCGGQRGVVEQNLVLCARDFSGGARIGLSLGGGGCAPQFCQPSFSSAVACVEHHDGTIRNNIIANCSDVGVYINASANSHVLYNSVIATSGIDFRFAAATGEARGNALSGVVRNRDGATATFANNADNLALAEWMLWFVAPLIGDLTIGSPASTLLGQGAAVATVTNDYCGRARMTPYDIGALQLSLGDCAGVVAPSPDLAGAPVVDLAGGAGAPDLGATASAGDEGCGCRYGDASTPATATALGSGTMALLVLLTVAGRRRSRRDRTPETR